MGPSEIGQVMGRMKNESDEREREAPDETMNESRAQAMGVSSFVIRVSPTCSRLSSALHLRRGMRKRKVNCEVDFSGEGGRWLVLGANMARKTQTRVLHSSPAPHPIVQYHPKVVVGGSGW